MGFSASESFDPLSQVENPLMGQYLNMVAMLVFLLVGGFQTLFLGGFFRSVQTLSVGALISGRESIVAMMAGGLTKLFLDAMVIALPILGTLFLTSLSTGLISKAAPQINLQSEGFPISILVAFVILAGGMPFMIEAFEQVINDGWESIQSLYIEIGRRI
jgi:flagellar biosynthetic protein FliR